MLQRQTVSYSLLNVLHDWMDEPVAKDFRLVGGTALALMLGHRESIDIDLFSNKPLSNELIQTIKSKKEVSILSEGNYHISFIEKGVKVDFAFWDFDFFPYENIENIRICHVLDIFAMKFDAITSRTVKKDFFDIAELIYHYTFQKGYETYSKKFPNQKKSTIILDAIGRIDDADSEPEPKLLLGQSWEGVKEYIKSEANRFFSKKWK